MYREIFEQQIYRFEAGSQTPFIIDGGANIGLSIIYFKQLYPQSRVVAFEPDSSVFRALEGNIRRRGYGDVQLHRGALWSSEKALSFMAEGADGGRIAQAGDPENVVVQTVRLRDYLNRPVDLLKLDIEGAETEVITDCADLLRNVQNLFVEYHSFEEKPQTLREVIDCLADAGFRLHIHSINASPQPLLRRYVSLGMDMQLNIFAFRL
ncbi:MAG TPA: FkbM family methyltransferase [Pyrinomonadaceae bacterium]|nr:FkbM family methyltransferase [Pyrinomonadaceae bacterium]